MTAVARPHGSGVRRKVFAAVGAFAATALLASCSNTTSEEAEGDSSGRVQMVIPTRDTNAFFATVSCEINEKAPAAGLDIQMIDVKSEDYSVQGYTTALLQAEAKSPDAIITGVPDTSAMDATLQQIRDDGIDLVTYDAVIDNESIPNAQVATDVYGTGVLAAQQMAKLTGETGRILVIDFAAGNPTTNARAKGFTDEVQKSYPNIEVLPVQYDESTPSKTAQIINATLASNPDLAGIFFTYNQAAINGMPSVMDATKPGAIKIVSSDSDPVLVDYLRDGYIQALLPQDAPKIVDAIIERTGNALAGEEINPVTLDVPPVVITPDNVDDSEVEGALYRTSC